MARRFRFVLVDVFAERPLAGNQLAVFTDARELETEEMQAIARELGFSETVFVLPAEAEGDVRLRIFTPRREVPFAGHPVLGAAFVLGGPLQRGTLALETAGGAVPVALERDDAGRIVFARMSQPVPAVAPYPDPAGLCRALGVERSLLPVETYDAGIRHAFVVLASAEEVAALAPDLAALAALGVAANCVARAGGSWKTRMFWPSAGIPEDAATGSAAGPLACHLARHGLVPWGEEIEIRQGEELGRPSLLYARAEAVDGEIARVEVGGAAVVVGRGELTL
ncbi:MAG TPA: PhzF family phenazine biosynthesis protein [Gaiellaceae bacterium]|nr:PhzF family phenazine biosynthesis protein [Gaiellaceae bacterium]